MKKTKAALAVLTAAAMVVGMTGCGSSSSSATTETSSSASASEGAGGSGEASAAGTSDLNIMLETSVMSLDPQQATDGTSFEVIADYTDG